MKDNHNTAEVTKLRNQINALKKRVNDKKVAEGADLVIKRMEEEF